MNTLTTGRAKLGSIFSADQASRRVTIPSASVVVLNGTPFQLVPAPGAGKVLIFVGATLALKYSGVAYGAPNAAADLVVKYQNAAGAQASVQCETTGFINATANAIRYIGALGSAATAGVGDVTPLVNQPLVLHNLNAAEFATGTSSLILYVLYRTIVTGF